MPVTPKSSPFLPEKVIPEFIGLFELSFSCSTIQLRTLWLIRLIRSIRFTESIATINKKTIRYYWYDQLTLQTSSNQWHHCCLIFRFSLLIKVRSIVVYNPVSSCWYAHLCFIFCFCLPLNPTVVPIEEAIMLSQRGMDYCCIYQNKMFIPGLLLLT